MSNVASKLKARASRRIDCALGFDFSLDTFWVIQSELHYLAGIEFSQWWTYISLCARGREATKDKIEVFT